MLTSSVNVIHLAAVLKLSCQSLHASLSLSFCVCTCISDKTLPCLNVHYSRKYVYVWF